MSENRDLTPDDPLDADAEVLDDAVLAQVRDALAVTEPIPDLVWARMERALIGEAATRAGRLDAAEAAPATGSDAGSEAALATVAPIHRRRRVLGGLMAAAAGVVAVAVIAPNVLNTGNDAAVVASAPEPAALAVDGQLAAEGSAADNGQAAPADALAAQPEAASAGPLALAAPPADAQAADAQAADAQVTAPQVEATPRTKSLRSLAARQVLATGTDYNPSTIKNEVIELVDTIDASHTHLLSSVTPDADLTEGTSGFTASADALAGCMEALTEEAGTQALFVDRAEFNGQDVGIVVVPVGAAATDPNTPFDQLDIWVVKPDCSAVQASVVWHDTLPVPAP